MPADVGLNGTELKVLQFIARFAVKKSYSPSMREITRHFRWSSPNAAKTHIDHLQEQGYLTVVPKVARSIVLTEAGWAASGVKRTEAKT